MLDKVGRKALKQKPMLRNFTAAFVALAVFLAPTTPLAAQDATNPYAFTQDYKPDPAIWVLEDEDTTIYLFGTIHALPPGFEWRSERLDTIIDEVDELVLETSDYSATEDALDVHTKLAHLMDKRTPTSQSLSIAGRDRWEKLIALSGMDRYEMDTTPVLLALLTIGVTGSKDQMASTFYGVETILEREFLRNGRPIGSLEDFNAVTYSMIRVPETELLADLDAQLVNWDGKDLIAFYDPELAAKTGDAYWYAEHNWAQGIVADDFSLGIGGGAITRALDGLLLDRRNRLWAEWIDARMDEPGDVLLAVGAGHFEGNVSLLAKLAERGFQVRRID